MKESSLYSSFFKEYRLLIIIPTVVILVLSYIYEVQKPPTFEWQRVYEYKYTNEQVSQDVILAEQLVGVLRERYGGEESGVNTMFYRSSPLTIHLTVTSNDQTKAEKTFNEKSPIVTENYPLKVFVDKRLYTKSNFNLLEIIAASVTVLIIATFIAALTNYFKKF